MSSSGFSGGNLVKSALDVKVDSDVADLDFTTRNCNGFKGHAQGLRDWKASFKLPFDDTDTNGLVLLMSAFVARTTVKVATVDEADKNGEVVEASVMKAGRDEKNGEIVAIDFELVPYFAAAIPPVVIGNA
jgi:hypothetical protein